MVLCRANSAWTHSGAADWGGGGEDGGGAAEAGRPGERCRRRGEELQRGTGNCSGQQKGEERVLESVCRHYRLRQPSSQHDDVAVHIDLAAVRDGASTEQDESSDDAGARRRAQCERLHAARHLPSISACVLCKKCARGSSLSPSPPPPPSLPFLTHHIVRNGQVSREKGRQKGLQDHPRKEGRACSREEGSRLVEGDSREGQGAVEGQVEGKEGGEQQQQ
ncbi:hypothetical protein K466DRAFT_392353 [Polyporus arcularius HHB13444]|uniref:Uncharacterized protein n=1 Tax=Polyporus arcularius HHB13444 TaxID=1314778 RepID=A0A5C3NTQ9_9APHY|nr:hypothetical protein K466DRAFT_392353 [Polyporus arcularius HHB13444]